MFIVGLFGWWYGAGWRERATMVGGRLIRIYDFFSIDLLIRTWFSPFRQISAGGVQGNISVQFRAFLDQLFSRAIGGFLRTLMIIIGMIVLVVGMIIGGIELLIWGVVPLLPVAGGIMYAIGWVPHAGI